MQPVDGTRTGKRNLADVFLCRQNQLGDLARCRRRCRCFAARRTQRPIWCPAISQAAAARHGPASSRTPDKDLWERSFRGTNAPADFLPPASNYVGSRGMIDASCDGSGSGTAASPWVPDDHRCDEQWRLFRQQPSFRSSRLPMGRARPLWSASATILPGGYLARRSESAGWSGDSQFVVDVGPRCGHRHPQLSDNRRLRFMH